MNTDAFWPLATVLLLGAFHGLNPAMGWLFSVALGLQEKSRHAVWTSLLPLALGHLISVGLVLSAMSLLGLVVPPHILRPGVAIMLVGFAVFLSLRHRHPRFGGMRMTRRDLVVWSFLVATAHGAGLMVVPFLIDAGQAAPDAAVQVASSAGEHALQTSGHGFHTGHAGALLDALPAGPALGTAAMLLHTLGYLLVLGLIAVVVYEQFGLRLLRTHWINLDVVWVAALVLTGMLTLVM